MAFVFSHSLSIIFFCFSFLASPDKTAAKTFTIINNCQRTIWPAILSGAGIPLLSTTGFELPSGQWRSIEAPLGWSGRLWARTSCVFYDSNTGFCLTGDCGTGEVECNGRGAAPPVTLAEFTLGDEKDFYDVSLVDGYNLPLVIEAGEGHCAAAGCAADVNERCPPELMVREAAACRSACQAFGGEEFCCSGEFASPAKCKPTAYSEVFKAACPDSYSYAYDDASSIFTCAGAGGYAVTFCPEGNPRCFYSYYFMIYYKQIARLVITVRFLGSEKSASTDPLTSPRSMEPWLANLLTDSAAEKSCHVFSRLLSLLLPLFFSLLHFCLS